MPDYSIAEAEEQACKTAAYFARVLREHEQQFLACRVDGASIVVAIGDLGAALERVIVEGELFGKGAVMRGPKLAPVAVLIALYHAPSEEFANKPGNIHLHVLNDAVLGRRVRKSGECLCSKKRGSKQQSVPPGAFKVCVECERVAAEFGLGWTLA